MQIPENILPLVDGDWILYLACNAVEYSLNQEWLKRVEECKKRNTPHPPEPNPNFNDITDVFEGKIKEIQNALQTTTSPILFFTGANNFRKELSKTKVYKGNRSSDKPYYYEDLKTYIETRYATEQEDNLEADDLMAICQETLDGLEVGTITCIVTVDKDLRQVNGWHYSPEGYNYPSFGPRYCTDDNSYIELSENRKKITGTGWKFFYSQCLTGDTVDNIPGLPRCGPVAAFDLLDSTTTEGEAFELVREAYRDKCLMADDYLLEQAQLLWMIRGYKYDGTLLHWSPPIVGEDSEDS